MSEIDCDGQRQSQLFQAAGQQREVKGRTHASDAIMARAFRLKLDPRHMPGQRALRRRALRAAKSGHGNEAGTREAVSYLRPAQVPLLLRRPASGQIP